MCSNQCSNVHARQRPKKAAFVHRPAATTSIDRYEPSLQPGGHARLAHTGLARYGGRWSVTAEAEAASSHVVQQPEHTLPTASDRYSPHRQRKDLQRPRRRKLPIRRQGFESLPSALAEMRLPPALPCRSGGIAAQGPLGQLAVGGHVWCKLTLCANGPARALGGRVQDPV
jgi:hypothetical protein